MEFNYRINTAKMVTAMKSHTCEKCKREIPKGDNYYIFKPYPRKGYWFAWRKRCISCYPRYYDEIYYYENQDSKIQQVHLIGGI